MNTKPIQIKATLFPSRKSIEIESWMHFTKLGERYAVTRLFSGKGFAVTHIATGFGIKVNHTTKLGAKKLAIEKLEKNKAVIGKAIRDAIEMIKEARA